MKEKYEIFWSEFSDRQLNKLNKKTIKRITQKLESITKNPFKFIKKLKGFDLYRLRVGDYRVILSIEKSRLVVFVLDVGHKKVIYRKY